MGYNLTVRGIILLSSLVAAVKTVGNISMCQSMADTLNARYNNRTLADQGGGVLVSVVFKQEEFLQEGVRSFTALNREQGLAPSEPEKGVAHMLYSLPGGPQVGVIIDGNEDGNRLCSGAENLNSHERKKHLAGPCEPRCPNNETVQTYRTRIAKYAQNSTEDWTQKICTLGVQQGAIQQKIQKLIALGLILNPTAVNFPPLGWATTWFNEQVLERAGGKVSAFFIVPDNKYIQYDPELREIQNGMAVNFSAAYEKATGKTVPVLQLRETILQAGDSNPFSCP